MSEEMSVKEFFSVLFQRNNYLPYIEIRLLSTDNPLGTPPITKRFGTVLAASEYINALRQSQKKVHVFFGVLPRNALRGRSTKETIRHGGVLWVDIDNKRLNNQTAMDVLKAYDKPPTLVVDSGNGAHAYWKLGSVTEDLDALEEANYYLQQLLESDMVWDRTRVLRVPTTVNPKYGRRAKVVVYNPDAVYELTDFIDKDKTTAGRIYKAKVAVVGELYDQDIREEIQNYKDYPDLSQCPSPYVRALIEKGIQADTKGQFKGDRDRMDFSVMLYLISHGLPEAQCKSVLCNPDWGISSKLLGLEVPRQARYLARTYERALSYLRQQQGEAP